MQHMLYWTLQKYVIFIVYSLDKKLRKFEAGNDYARFWEF